MSLGYMSGSVDLEDLSRILGSQEIYSDHVIARKAVRNVLTLMSFGQNLKVLSPLMVKLLAHQDLLVKKVACHYLVEYSRDENEHTLLAINTLMTDTTDSNPTTRALALKTLCSLQNESYLDYGLKCLTAGLKDRSAYVRRVAVNSCQRLHDVSLGAVIDSGLVDELYGMIRDTDPIVLVNSLSVLEEILEVEGGVVISQSMAHHILNSLPKLTEWGLVTVMSILSKYTPKSEDEMFDMMNVTDSYLKHSNLAVSTSCLKYFGVLVREYSDLKLEVFTRARDSILAALTSGNTELTFTVLELVTECIPECKSVFTDHIHAFLCRHNEPPYIKIKRLHLLSELVTEENMAEILEEIAVSCTDNVTEVSAVAVSKLGDLARVSPSSFAACVSKLKDLVEFDLGPTLSNVALVIEDLTEDSAVELTPVVECLCGKYLSVTDLPGRAAFLRILGLYKEQISDAVYILEDLIDSWLEEADVELKRSFLTAGLKLFFWSPSSCQESLGQILEKCVTDDDRDISESALFYYRLLQGDPQRARTLVEVTGTCTS